MLPESQQSLSRRSRAFQKEDKALSSTVSIVSQPKGLIQTLYSYMQYGIYSLRYLKQRIFARNKSFALPRTVIPFAADRRLDAPQNQSHFGLENSIPFTNQIDLNLRMIAMHLSESSANFSLLPTNHSLEIQNLIPWAQLMLHYLPKSKAQSSSRKKSAPTSFFDKTSQASMHETSFVLKHLEKNRSISMHRE